jgi:hypothetical protein
LEWLQEIPSSPTIRLNLQPRNNQSFSTFDRLRLLIMALDRHVNYQNAVCDSQENGESINLHLSRLKKYPDKMDDGSLDNLSIYLRNYHHLNLSPLKIRTIKIREGMVDWYNRKLILQFRLFSARLKMKINIEKGRLSQIISNRFK